MSGLGSEDHLLRQYFYSQSTLQLLVHICESSEPQCIALLSAPSVFFALDAGMRQRALLLEYDRRWERDNDKFIFYDYHIPVQNLPSALQNSCDLIIADPPHIDLQTLRFYVQTIDFLRAKGGHLLLTSAADNEQWIASELGLFAANFVPKSTAAWAELGRFRLFTDFGNKFKDVLGSKNLQDFPQEPDDDTTCEDYSWTLGMVEHPL